MKRFTYRLRKIRDKANKHSPVTKQQINTFQIKKMQRFFAVSPQFNQLMGISLLHLKIYRINYKQQLQKNKFPLTLLTMYCNSRLSKFYARAFPCCISLKKSAFFFLQKRKKSFPRNATFNNTPVKI